MKAKLIFCLLLSFLLIRPAIAANDYDFYLNYFNKLGFRPAMVFPGWDNCKPEDSECLKNSKNMITADSAISMSSTHNDKLFNNVSSTVKYLVVICDSSYMEGPVKCNSNSVQGIPLNTIYFSEGKGLTLYKEEKAGYIKLYIPQSYLISREYSKDLSRYLRLQTGSVDTSEKKDESNASKLLGDYTLPFDISVKVLVGLLFLCVAYKVFTLLKNPPSSISFRQIYSKHRKLFKKITGGLFLVLLIGFVLILIFSKLLLSGQDVKDIYYLIIYPLRYKTFIANIKNISHTQLFVGVYMYVMVFIGILYILDEFIGFSLNNLRNISQKKTNEKPLKTVYVVLSFLLIFTIHWVKMPVLVFSILFITALLLVISNKLIEKFSYKHIVLLGLSLLGVQLVLSSIKVTSPSIGPKYLPQIIYLPYNIKLKEGQIISDYKVNYSGNLFLNDFMIHTTNFKQIQNKEISLFKNSDNYIIQKPANKQDYYKLLLTRTDLIPVFTSPSFAEAFYYPKKPLGTYKTQITINYSCTRNFDTTNVDITKYTSTGETKVTELLTHPGCFKGKTGSFTIPYNTDLARDAIYYFSFNPDITGISLVINDKSEKPVYLKNPDENTFMVEKYSRTNNNEIYVYNFNHSLDTALKNDSNIFDVAELINNVKREFSSPLKLWGNTPVQYLKKLE